MSSPGCTATCATCPAGKKRRKKPALAAELRAFNLLSLRQCRPYYPKQVLLHPHHDACLDNNSSDGMRKRMDNYFARRDGHIGVELGALWQEPHLFVKVALGLFIRLGAVGCHQRHFGVEVY